MCIVDTLRRAKFTVELSSVEASHEVTCSRGVKLVADSSIAEAATRSFDAVVLPGGMPGAERLRDCKTLTSILRHQKSAGKWYGAICASPAVVLAAHGLIDAHAAATCYPSAKFVDAIPDKSRIEERVVVDADAKLITSRGPGTAIEFAVAVIHALAGRSAAEAVASGMLIHP